MGDGLHSSINALDSAFLFDVHADYSGGAQPVKVIAEGRDPSATIDSALVGARATASRTRATTRSPASTSRTATRRPTACSAPRSRQPLSARLAPLLHPPARRQRDLGDRPRRVAAHRTFAHRVTPRPGHLPGPHPFAFRLSAQLYSSRGDQSLPRPSGVRSSIAHSGHMKSTCRGCWPSGSVGALSSSLLQK